MDKEEQDKQDAGSCLAAIIVLIGLAILLYVFEFFTKVALAVDEVIHNNQVEACIVFTIIFIIFIVWGNSSK